MNVKIILVYQVTTKEVIIAYFVLEGVILVQI
jgi:hypothetical protein